MLDDIAQHQGIHRGTKRFSETLRRHAGEETAFEAIGDWDWREFHTIGINSPGDQVFHQDSAPASDVQHAVGGQGTEVVLQDAIACQMPVLPFDAGRISVGELIRAKLSVYLLVLVNSAMIPCL